MSEEVHEEVSKEVKEKMEMDIGKVFIINEKTKATIEFYGEYVMNNDVLLDIVNLENELEMENLTFYKQEFDESKGLEIVINGHFEGGSKYFVEGTKILKFPKNYGYRTGICVDLRMNDHSPDDSEIKEIPARLEGINELIKSRNSFEDEYYQVKARYATVDELKLCHDEKYINDMEDFRIKGSWGEFYVCEETVNATKLSCGAVLSSIDEVMSGKIDNAFVCSRPPGHHALFDSPKGFCFFSNVTIGAKYLRKKYGVKKIMIFDWDVHHGNSTQDLRMEDENILFVSVHKNFYPNTGDIENIGPNKNTINIQFDNSYSCAAMLNSFHQIILPVATEFLPDFIFVSAGYDAVEFDPYGGCGVQPPIFGHLTSMLMNIIGGKNLILVLEGGYNIKQLRKCVDCSVKALRGYPTTPLNKIRNKFLISKKEQKILKKVKNTHSKNWKCFVTEKIITEEEEEEEEGEKVEEEKKKLVYEKVTELEDDDDGEGSIFAPQIDINSLKMFQYGGRFVKFNKDE